MWSIILPINIKLKSIIFINKKLLFFNSEKINFLKIYQLKNLSSQFNVVHFNNYFKTNLIFIIINQLSKNIKINTMVIKKSSTINKYQSTGSFLNYLNLLKKSLKRETKGTRLFCNMYLKPIILKNLNKLIIFFIRGFHKTSWIHEALPASFISNKLIFLTGNEKIFSNLKIKKSIKKRIKKKIVIKENVIW